MIRRDGDPAAVTYLMGYDSTPIRAEKSLYIYNLDFAGPLPLDDATPMLLVHLGRITPWVCLCEEGGSPTKQSQS